MKHDLEVSDIFKANLDNIIRLAEVLNIPGLDKMKKLPDAKWRIACAIARWYKRNPK